MNTNKIGNFITKLRKEKNLTQIELANKLNVSDKAVSRWETGKNLPDVSILENLARELSVSVSELLLGEKIEDKDFKEKSEYNTINTLNYTKEKLEKKNKNIFVVMILLVFLIFVTSSLYLTTITITEFNSTIKHYEIIYKKSLEDDNIKSYANILKTYYSLGDEIDYKKLAIFMVEKLSQIYNSYNIGEDSINSIAKNLEIEFKTNKNIDFYELAKSNIEEKYKLFVEEIKNDRFTPLDNKLQVLTLFSFIIISIILSIYFIVFIKFDNVKRYAKSCYRYFLLLICLLIIYYVLIESLISIIENKTANYSFILNYNLAMNITVINYLISLSINLLFNIKNIIKYKKNNTIKVINKEK